VTDAPKPTEKQPAALDAASPSEARPPYGWAAIVAGSVFLLYALTLAPTTAFWDTSEYIATAHILGIPHPPGNPLFVVLARFWELLLAPTGLAVAVRINLFSAFNSAVAHGLWFLCVHHVLRYFTDDRRIRLTGAAVAVLVSATAFTVWNQSNVNEKVYTVSLVTITVLSWLAFRWQENIGKGKDDNLLVLMGFILALSIGNHLMAFLAAPAIALFVLIVRPRTLLNWKLYPALLVVGVLGLSIHLVLPLRAGLHPLINEAAPTCESLGGALTAVISYGKAGCVALSESLNRSQYQKPPMFPRLAPLHMQLVNYLQYFDWQWARSISSSSLLFAGGRLPFTLLFAWLGGWGAAEHYRRDKASFWYFAALFGTLSVALTFYLNFKYGYSIPAPTRNLDLHEVRERDYFFIVSFSVWGLWAGIGIVSFWQSLAERLGSMKRAAPALLLAFIPLLCNATWAKRNGDYAARDWAYNLLMSVEPYGVLFTNGDNDTFPLWYLQEVEGIRQDVTVIVTSYLNTDWYAIQLKAMTAPCEAGVTPSREHTQVLCQRPYTAENTPAMYTADPEEATSAGKTPIILAGATTIPTRPVLTVDDETIRSTTLSYATVPEARGVDLGSGVTARLPGGMVVYPWHQFALSIISTVLGERPIYFATSGTGAGELGLEEYLIRQGLAMKLNPGPITVETLPAGVDPLPPQSALSMVTGLFVDSPRTAKLVDSVFVHRSGLPNWKHWPDPSTLGIPNYYAWAYWALAEAAQAHQDEPTSRKYQAAAEAWSLLGS
jgi:hypothetical protein